MVSTRCILVYVVVCLARLVWNWKRKAQVRKRVRYFRVHVCQSACKKDMKPSFGHENVLDENQKLFCCTKWRQGPAKRTQKRGLDDHDRDTYRALLHPEVADWLSIVQNLAHVNDLKFHPSSQPCIKRSTNKFHKRIQEAIPPIFTQTLTLPTGPPRFPMAASIFSCEVDKADFGVSVSPYQKAHLNAFHQSNHMRSFCRVHVCI